MRRRHYLFKRIILYFLLLKTISGLSNSSIDVKQPDMSNYDLLFYRIDLAVSDTSIYIKGNVSMNIRILDNQKEDLVFNLSDNYTIDSVLINKHKQEYRRDNNYIYLNPVDLFKQNEIIEICFYYKGKGYEGEMDTEEWDKGIYNKGNHITYTVSEPYSLFIWLPCKQVLTDKIDSASIFITVDTNLLVGSNGKLQKITETKDNKLRFEWKTKYPIAYYLISFSVANYMDYSFYTEINNKKMLVQNFIPNDSVFLAENKADIDETANFLKLFSDLFGEYPFINEKYGHCIAPVGGGMEHQTMTTLSSFYFELIAHELAHQWFGNYVTCASFQDIWINEGFASYLEYIALQNLKNKEDAESWIRQAHRYAEGQPDKSIFVPAEDTSNFYRVFNFALSYKKGASILHMIRFEVNNDDLFFDILRTYLQKYSFKNAYTRDFKQFLEEKTNINFDDFFEQWYYGKGSPEYMAKWRCNEDTLYLEIIQETTSSTSLFTNNFGIKLRFKNNEDTTIRLHSSANYEKIKIPVKNEISNITLNPDFWNMMNVKGVTYSADFSENMISYKVRLVSSTKLLKIRFDEKWNDYYLDIYDSYGKPVISFKVNEQKHMYDLSSLKNGEYFLVIKNDTSFCSEKLTLLNY